MRNEILDLRDYISNKGAVIADSKIIPFRNDFTTRRFMVTTPKGLMIINEELMPETIRSLRERHITFADLNEALQLGYYKK